MYLTRNEVHFSRLVRNLLLLKGNSSQTTEFFLAKICKVLQFSACYNRMLSTEKHT